MPLDCTYSEYNYFSIKMIETFWENKCNITLQGGLVPLNLFMLFAEYYAIYLHVHVVCELLAIKHWSLKFYQHYSSNKAKDMYYSNLKKFLNASEERKIGETNCME